MQISEINLIDEIDQNYPEVVLEWLLRDRTTRKNIVWATDIYAELGAGYQEKDSIERAAITKENNDLIQPRVSKNAAIQQARTRTKAEVMTPSWVCNMMNNHLDADWFGTPDVFNHENDDHTWIVNENPVRFPEGKTWQKYVDERRLEITCGEAPFLVSRYDTTTGEIISVERRIGLLDRKFRIVNENAKDEEEWLKWAFRALEASYGYEWQGDNLLLGRINCFQTFVDNLQIRWNRGPTKEEAKRAALIVSWNLWQMDGLNGTTPIGKPEQQFEQMDIFSFMSGEERAPLCKIMNWRSNESMLYISTREM